MRYLKIVPLLFFSLGLLSCGPKDDEKVELVPEAANEIRLISSEGINPPINLRSAILNGDYAYLTVRSWDPAATTGGLYVYSLAGLDGVTTRNIQEQRFVAAPHQTVTMARSGNSLYVGGEGGFSVFDISDPAIPVLGTTINVPASFSLKVYGITLFVVEAQSVTLYDISDTSNPALLTTINSAGFNAAFFNGYIYSGNGISTSFYIRDINVPSVLSASVTLPGVPYHIEVVQNYLVVVANTINSSSVKVYSLADPVNVSLTDQRSYAFPMKAFASDGQNILLSGPDLGEILQLTNQGSLNLLQTITNGSATTVDGFPYFSAIETNRALISGDDYALLYRF